jgi:proteic killer suppression protein
MNILYKDSRLQKLFESNTDLQRQYGDQVTRALMRRINLLQSVPHLADPDLYSKPSKCHQLEGNRDEQFAVRVDGQYRIVFCVAHDPIPRKPDNGIDTIRVTIICIIELSKHYG